MEFYSWEGREGNWEKGKTVWEGGRKMERCLCRIISLNSLGWETSWVGTLELKETEDVR